MRTKTFKTTIGERELTALQYLVNVHAVVIGEKLQKGNAFEVNLIYTDPADLTQIFIEVGKTVQKSELTPSHCHSTYNQEYDEEQYYRDKYPDYEG